MADNFSKSFKAKSIFDDSEFRKYDNFPLTESDKFPLTESDKENVLEDKDSSTDEKKRKDEASTDKNKKGKETLKEEKKEEKKEGKKGEKKGLGSSKATAGKNEEVPAEGCGPVPVSSSDGANAASVSDEVETLTDDTETDYYISILFALVPHDGLVDDNGDYSDPDLRYNKPHLIHSLVWEEHPISQDAFEKFDEPLKHNSLKIMADCSEIILEPETGIAILFEDEMLLVIENTLKEIADYIDMFPKSSKKRTVHLMLSGFFPIEDIVFAFSRVMKHHLPNESCYEEFITKAEGIFSFFTEQYETEDIQFKVDYTCLYEAYEIQVEAHKDIKRAFIEVEYLCQRACEQSTGGPDNPYMKEYHKNHQDVEKAWLERKPLPDPEYRAAQLEAEQKGEYFDPSDYIKWQNKLWSIKELDELSWEYRNQLSDEELKEASQIIWQMKWEDYGYDPAMERLRTHLCFAIASIVCSPISLLDAALHAYEMSQDHDPSHKKEIFIDIVCAIPFVSIFKAAKAVRGYKAAKATLEAAEVNLNVAKADLKAAETGLEVANAEARLVQEGMRGINDTVKLAENTTTTIQKSIQTSQKSYNSTYKAYLQAQAKNVIYLMDLKTSVQRLEALQKLKQLKNSLKEQIANTEYFKKLQQLQHERLVSSYRQLASSGQELQNAQGKLHSAQTAYNSAKTAQTTAAAVKESETILGAIESATQIKGLTHYKTFVENLVFGIKEKRYADFVDSIFEGGGLIYTGKSITETAVELYNSEEKVPDKSRFDNSKGGVKISFE